MNLQELNAHWRKIQVLMSDREILCSVQQAIAPKGQNLTGMPHTPGVSDKTADLAIELAEIEDHIAQMEKEIKAEEPQIEAFISTIGDARTKLIFRLRFIRGYSWKEVSAVLGKYCSETTARAACYRFFDVEQRRAAEAESRANQTVLSGFE